MAETVEIIRDILLSVYLAAGILLALALLVIVFLLYRAVRGLIKSITRITDNVGRVSDLTVEHLATPIKEGASFSGAVGNAVGFLTGFLSGLRDRHRRDGEEERGRRRRR